jgi:hypothetical protein
MGRGKLSVSEATVLALEKLAAEVVGAVARGELERARELTEMAIRLRADELAVRGRQAQELTDVVMPVQSPAKRSSRRGRDLSRRA